MRAGRELERALRQPEVQALLRLGYPRAVALEAAYPDLPPHTPTRPLPARLHILPSIDSPSRWHPDDDPAAIPHVSSEQLRYAAAYRRYHANKARNEAEACEIQTLPSFSVVKGGEYGTMVGREYHNLEHRAATGTPTSLRLVD